MKRRAQQAVDALTTDSAHALTRYVTALEAIYPEAKGNYRVATSDEGYLVVGVPLPKNDDKLVRLFEQMAKVATRLLVETDQCIVLTSK
jgi:hypothetical protein